jgi:hypothetical protein
LVLAGELLRDQLYKLRLHLTDVVGWLSMCRVRTHHFTRARVESAA